MNEHQTTVLTSRLRQLADDLTPPLDIVAQVRDARAGHQRRRRMRIALLAAATATAVLLVGVPLTIGSLTSEPSGRVAGPVPTTTSSITPEDGDAVRRAAEEAALRAQLAAEQAAEHAAAEQSSSPIPDGWARRSFLGVDFAVPPGARMEDYVEPTWLTECDCGNTFIWNGPDLGGDRKVYSHVKLIVGDGRALDPAAYAGYDVAVVPGTTHAYVSTETGQVVDVDNQPFQVLDMALDAWTGAGQHVHVDATLPAGPEGEQMARDLVASLVVG